MHYAWWAAALNFATIYDENDKYWPSHSQFLSQTTSHHWEFWWHHPFFQWAYSHQQHHDEPSQQCSRNLGKWKIHFMSLHRNNDKDCYAKTLSYLGSARSRLSWISPETGFQLTFLPFLGEAFWGTRNPGYRCPELASPMTKSYIAWDSSKVPLCHYATTCLISIQKKTTQAARITTRGCITYCPKQASAPNIQALAQNGHSTENIQLVS